MDMPPLEPKRYGKRGPEAVIQKAIIEMLERKGWYTKIMAASVYLTGLPDVFASHKLFGPRFIEVKLPGMVGSKFTPAQLIEFPKICANGFGVWILTADTESEYAKLKQPPNWWKYLKIMKG
jgi:hypothetical protein